MTKPNQQNPAPPAPPRVICLAPKDILVARVARKCMMRLCEALVTLGSEVELISMRVETVASEPTRTRSIWDVYGVQPKFRVTMIPTLLRQTSMNRPLSKILSQLIRVIVYPLYVIRAYRRLKIDGTHPERTLFYTRNYACALGVLPMRKLLRTKTRIMLEIHLPPRNALQKTILRLVDGVACQSESLHSLMVGKGLVRSDRSIGRHGGCDPLTSNISRPTRREAREYLGWGQDERIACYTGKVSRGLHEIELMVSMAAYLAPDRVRVVIVGGREDHVAMWREEVTKRGVMNVEFIPFVAPSEVPRYQIAANVLLLYYEAGNPLNDFRSPGKLFEYMTSGTPTVVADYLSIREIIHDGENGLLVPPNNPESLAKAVRRLTNDQDLANRLANRAKVDVASYTWTTTANATLSLADQLWNSKAWEEA